MNVADAILTGFTVLVTRSRAQAPALSALLRLEGARVVEVATPTIEAPSDEGKGLSRALANIDSYSWICLTSPNGARLFADRVIEADLVGRLPSIAVVGPATERVLSDRGIEVDLVADRHHAEGLAEALGKAPHNNVSVLVAQAEVARATFVEDLRGSGWRVDRAAVYRNVSADIGSKDHELIAEADIVTFAASSAVQRLCRAVAPDRLPPIVACIGPVTAATARSHGLGVDVMAEVHTIDGLVDALIEWANNRVAT